MVMNAAMRMVQYGRPEDQAYAHWHWIGWPRRLPHAAVPVGAAGRSTRERKGVQDYSAKILEFTNANISAAVEQATKLASVKSPMEFFALSNDYAKRQVGILTRQAQELAAILQRMTTSKDR